MIALAQDGVSCRVEGESFRAGRSTPAYHPREQSSRGARSFGRAVASFHPSEQARWEPRFADAVFDCRAEALPYLI